MPTEIFQCDDVGLILRSIPQNRIRNLLPNQKYSIFVKHFKPNSSFKFPSRYFDGCNRACQHSYFENNPWFVYSKAEDGIFCLPCVLFAKKDNLGQFVGTKFNLWSKKSKKFAAHNSKQYHQMALTQMNALKSTVTCPQFSIESRLQHISMRDIAKNRSIINCMTEAVLFCGRQNIALRGHHDDSDADPESNRGNFLALLNYSIFWQCCFV